MLNGFAVVDLDEGFLPAIDIKGFWSRGLRLDRLSSTLSAIIKCEYV
jgi:hypothetical protein